MNMQICKYGIMKKVYSCPLIWDQRFLHDVPSLQLHGLASTCIGVHVPSSVQRTLGHLNRVAEFQCHIQQFQWNGACSAVYNVTSNVDGDT